LTTGTTWRGRSRASSSSTGSPRRSRHPSAGASNTSSGSRRSSSLRRTLRECLDLLIDLYEYLTRQIIRINKKVALLCRDKKYRDRIRLLCTAPGIGRLTAIEILVELQDVSRFESAEELASFIGLTPSEYSPGERTRQGRITRCGNKRVRTYLVESTWILITKDPAMRLKYLKLKNLRGGKRATIAIARKLLLIIRRMLLDNVPYRMTAMAA
jgi:transposase